MIDTHRLRFLCQLAVSGTMAAAADSLNYSPSAVAQHIHALERELGVRLIEPVGRNVRLTAPARILVDQARSIFAQLEQAQALVAASLDSPQGTLRVAAFQTAAFGIIAQAVGRCAEQYPQVTIEFTQGENDSNVAGLVDNRFDLVVFETYPGLPLELHDDLVVQPVVDDPLWLMVPDGIAGTIDVEQDAIKQVSELPWAMEPPGTHPRRWAFGECQRAGFVPRIRYVSADTLLHLHLVEAGLAVALLPSLALGAARGGASRFAPIAGQLPPARTLFMASRRSTTADPTMAAVRQLLMAVVQEQRVFDGSARPGGDLVSGSPGKRPSPTGGAAVPAPPGVG